MNSTAICVLGLHRSGTSMLSNLLAKSGIYWGPPEALLGPKKENPKGYWEHQEIIELNDNILTYFSGAWNQVPHFPKDWFNDPGLTPLKQRAKEILAPYFEHPLWGFKDPRFCLTLPFWKTLIPNIQLIVPYRDPFSIALSLQQRNKKRFPLPIGLEIVQTYFYFLIQQLKNENYIFTFYDHLLTQPEQEIDRIFQFHHFQNKPNLSVYQDIISPEHQHHQSKRDYEKYLNLSSKSGSNLLIDFILFESAYISERYHECRREDEQHSNSDQRIIDLETNIKQQKAELSKLKSVQQKLIWKAQHHEGEVKATESLIADIHNSFSWKITEPLRFCSRHFFSRRYKS